MKDLGQRTSAQTAEGARETPPLPTLDASGWHTRLPSHLKRMELPLAVWDYIAGLDGAYQRSLEREQQLRASLTQSERANQKVSR
jgi:hypothetical protein